MIRPLVIVALLAATAHAQPSLDPDTEAARRHFERGLELYGQEHYQEAIDEFGRAKSLRAMPAFDYNIGRCQDRLERWSEAADSYQRYLDTTPDAPERASLSQRITLLRSRAAAKERSEPAHETPVPASPPPNGAGAPANETATGNATPTLTAAPPRRSWARRNATALGVGGAALALAVVGSALVGSVAPDYARLDSGPQSCRPCMPSQYSGLVARADAGYALWAVAGAAALVDVGLFVAAARRR